jgi:hypothetical protein
MQKNRSLVLMACLALLTVFLSGTVTTAMPPTQATEVVFKTPEEAITVYLEGVAQGDFAKILQACAIDEMSENFKFDLYIERLRAFVPQAPSPANDPFYVELNKAQFSAQIANQVKNFAYGLLSTEEVSEGKTIIMDVDRAITFMKDVDPNRLISLKVKQVGIPNKTRMNSARYLEIAAKIALVYGADESTERVTLFSFEQNYYYIGFSLLRYGENWKISSQASPMGNTSVLGVPTKTTEAQFETIINGN